MCTDPEVLWSSGFNLIKTGFYLNRTTTTENKKSVSVLSVHKLTRCQWFKIKKTKKHQGLSWGTFEAAAVCFYFESRAAWLRCFPLRSAGWPGPRLSALHSAEHPELSAAAAAAAAHRDFISQPGAQLTHKYTTEEESDFNRGEEFDNRWVKHLYTLCIVKFSLGQMKCGSNEDFHMTDVLNVLNS